MEQLEEQINKDIKERLKEHRYLHSIGVMEMAEKLAKHYNLDVKKARLIGLAHDIAKQMTWEEINKYIQEYGIELDEIERNNHQLIHAKIGADMCKRKYGFDEQMTNAVLYHTTGHLDMDMMAKIIFIADKVEKTRDYEGVEKRRKLAFEDIDRAIIETINYTTKKCLEEGELVHPNSVMTRNKLLIMNKNIETE